MASTARPDWDLGPFFAGLDEAVDYRAALQRELRALGQEAQETGPLDGDRRAAWVALLGRLEGLSARLWHLGAYLGCRSAAESADEAVQRETAALAATRSELDKVLVRVRAALRDADGAEFEALVAEPELGEVAWFLRRTRQRAAWSMETELETLAAELDVTGLSAWGRLYDQASGKLEFDLEVPGQAPRRLPVAMARSLLEDPDAAVRRATLVGANAAWEGMADVTAACLNGIAGTRLTLYRRRGVPHFLEPALHDAAISRRTLDTLLEVVRERADVPRRYLRTKARILGRERLGWQDLLAPLPLEQRERVPFGDATRRLVDAFRSSYPALGDFAADAIERRWIDWSPRPGKRPGGFCTGSPLLEESRVFLTYNDAPGDLRTLAHELGHAFHSALMRGMRPWARRYPMTLAETASTFAEQVAMEAVLESPQTSREQRAAVLDSSLTYAALFLLNIPTRFSFERALYEERAEGELAVGRLRELALAAQLDWYGEALDPEERNPWLWASTLHFYITGLSFYNFPYTFGYLFSLGLFERARAEGPDFLPRYEALLRRTGSDTAEGVARDCLDVDLERPEFWHASIDGIERDLERFTPEADALFPRSA